MSLCTIGKKKRAFVAKLSELNAGGADAAVSLTLLLRRLEVLFFVRVCEGSTVIIGVIAHIGDIAHLDIAHIGVIALREKKKDF